MQRRSGDAITAQHPPGRRPSDAVFAGEPGVQPALTGMKGRWMALVTSGTRERSGSRLCATPSVVFARRSSQHGAGVRFKRLFFGDFLLAPQKKVTALPGAHPGMDLGDKPPQPEQPK